MTAVKASACPSRGKARYCAAGGCGGGKLIVAARAAAIAGLEKLSTNTVLNP